MGRSSKESVIVLLYYTVPLHHPVSNILFPLLLLLLLPTLCLQVDSFFMALSVYARIGALTGNQTYFDKMHRNFIYSALTPHPNGFAFWSQPNSLFYRDPPKDHPNGVFWSRGNGWAAAALVQALKYAPAEDPHTQTYRVVFRQHMQRVGALQGADGCWRSSLLAPGVCCRVCYGLGFRVLSCILSLCRANVGS